MLPPSSMQALRGLQAALVTAEQALCYDFKSAGELDHPLPAVAALRHELVAPIRSLQEILTDALTNWAAMASHGPEGAAFPWASTSHGSLSDRASNSAFADQAPGDKPGLRAGSASSLTGQSSPGRSPKSGLRGRDDRSPDFPLQASKPRFQEFLREPRWRKSPDKTQERSRSSSPGSPSAPSVWGLLLTPKRSFPRCTFGEV